MGEQEVNKHVLDQWLKDYHCMVNTLKELRNGSIVGAKTTQVEILATLPKAAGRK